MTRKGSIRLGAVIFATAVMILFPQLARAVPSFAQQTGQPCTSCHIGAYGPQLTAFGRAFKIGGYTQTGGEGWQSGFPLFADAARLLHKHQQRAGCSPPRTITAPMAISPWTRSAPFSADASPTTLAGFVQGPSMASRALSSWTTPTLRLTSPFQVYDTELRLGVDVNNGPTVQDPVNSTYAWGYPFVASALAPTPAAQPLLAGGLIGNSIGATRIRLV